MRRSRDEIRSLLLRAGQDLVHEEGVEPGFGNITFKKVFDRVEKDTGIRITNASVIGRAWENQAAFQADVLVSIAQDRGRPERRCELEHAFSDGQTGLRPPAAAPRRVLGPASRARAGPISCQAG